MFKSKKVSHRNRLRNSNIFLQKWASGIGVLSTGVLVKDVLGIVVLVKDVLGIVVLVKDIPGTGVLGKVVPGIVVLVKDLPGTGVLEKDVLGTVDHCAVSCHATLLTAAGCRWVWRLHVP